MKDSTILDRNAFNNKQNRSFETYKTFASREQAEGYIELLKKHDIPYSAESSEQILTSAIVGSSGMLPKVVLKLHPSDFSNIDALIEQQILEAGNVPEDYYLKELDDNELREVLEKPDEWSIQDVSMARLILKERGIQISGKEIEDLRENRIREIRQGKKANRGIMFLWFLAIAVGFWFLGIIALIAGIGMGYYYGYDKSIDPNGNKYHTFESKTREYGKLILIVGVPIVIITFAILYMISQNKVI